MRGKWWNIGWGMGRAKSRAAVWLYEGTVLEGGSEPKI
jgi:hypothetical protein